MCRQTAILVLGVALQLARTGWGESGNATSDAHGDGAADGNGEGEDEEPLLPRHRLTYDNVIAVRYNPLGLEDRIDVRYRLRLYDNPKPLFRDAHLGIAFTSSLTPAVSRVGATLIVEPLTILTLKAGYYYKFWYGNFHYLQSYQSARDDHSAAAIENGDNYATDGHQWQFDARLLAKVGPVVFRSLSKFLLSINHLRNGDTLYYDARYDVMVANDGWMMSNDTDLVFLTDFGLVAGIRNSVVHAFYGNRHFLPGESRENPNSPTVLLGPLVAYVFYDKPERIFNQPTLLLIVGWWLKHRYLTGADMPQAVPCLILGFAFEGVLWAGR